jgi:3'-5' exoribonuclease
MELDDYVSSVLKVTSKRMQTTRDGKNFLLLTFEDRSGTMRGIDWWNAELNDERLTQGTVVRVEGKIKLFDAKKQLNIKNSKDAITVLSKDEYDPKKFIEINQR